MGTQEVIKCRTLFIGSPHVRRLPVQTVCCFFLVITASFTEFSSSCFPAVKLETGPALQRRFPSSLLAVRSARWFNVWSHKTNLSFGKSYKQPLPSRRVDVKTDAQLPSHDTISKECLLQSVLRGKTTTVSKLVAFQPTFNFRVLITVCTSDTFPSVTSLTRHEVAPLQPVIERFFIQDAAVM